MISAIDDHAIRRQAIASGACAYLVKPIATQVLRDAIGDINFKHWHRRGLWGIFKPECPSNGVLRIFYIPELPMASSMPGNAGHEKIVISTGGRNLLFLAMQ